MLNGKVCQNHQVLHCCCYCYLIVRQITISGLDEKNNTKSSFQSEHQRGGVKDRETSEQYGLLSLVTYEIETIYTFSGCSFISTGSTGTIKSPNYPAKYSPNVDCTYTIKTQNGHLIKLAFDTFSLEHHNSCDNDYVAIHDGEDGNAPLLGKFCGTKSPQIISSSSNTLFLRMKTDLAGEDKGFHAQYSTGTNCK